VEARRRVGDGVQEEAVAMISGIIVTVVLIVSIFDASLEVNLFELSKLESERCGGVVFGIVNACPLSLSAEGNKITLREYTDLNHNSKADMSNRQQR
jgi:hypothetical protein